MTKLEAKNISKSFGELQVLQDINITVKTGEFVSVLGVSGSGKSTLLNILAGLDTPDCGSVLKDGGDITGISGKIGYMQQNDLLLPWRTVLDNICLPLYLAKMKKADARAQAMKHMERFGLGGFEKYYPHQLSGGMRQRAALFRTYLFSGDVALLDEPFAKLDAITKSGLQKWLWGIYKENKTAALLITHDVEEAMLLSDRIYVISDKPAVIKNEYSKSEFDKEKILIDLS